MRYEILDFRQKTKDKRQKTKDNNKRYEKVDENKSPPLGVCLTQNKTYIFYKTK